MEAKKVRSLMEAYASVYEGYGKEKNEKSEKKEKECVDKEDKGKHNCAKKVCHEQFGEGTCIFGEHAAPDENGVVNFYDVLFEHGVEKDVPLSELEVLEEGSHNENYHRYEGEMVEGAGMVVGTAKAVNAALKPKGQTPEQGKKAVRNLTKAMDTVAKPLKSAAKAALSVGDKKNEAMKNKRRPTAAQASRMEDVDLFDIVKEYLIGEGATESEVYDMMAHLTDDQRDAIVESMASANRMKEIKERGFERPARSREFEKRLPKERGSRGPEFEHGSTRSSDKPSGNLSANRGGGKGGARSREFEHGSTRSRNTPSANLGDGMPRDKKGNIMY